jgi:hypothetical protein
MTSDLSTPPVRRRNRLLQLLAAVGLLLAAYLLAAYVVLPFGWRNYAKRHPALEDLPNVTHTAAGIPGDPITLALVGNSEDVRRALLAAGWHPADPITLKSCLEIAGATVLRRSYEDAPVSSLYLWGRKQDLAFEQPVGHDPRKRHHVRFWRSDGADDQGRPLWAGAATFDTRVGFSHTTGQITHHIDSDLDRERDKLLADLQGAGKVAELSWVDDFREQREGKNGGGDRYFTDGRLPVVTLTP